MSLVLLGRRLVLEITVHPVCMLEITVRYHVVYVQLLYSKSLVSSLQVGLCMYSYVCTPVLYPGGGGHSHMYTSIIPGGGEGTPHIETVETS